MSQRQALVEQLAQRQWDRDADRLSQHLGRPLTWSERQALRPTQDQVQALSRASREAKIPQSRAGAGGGLGTGDRRPRLRSPAAPLVPSPTDGAPPAAVAERPAGDVAQDLAAWALGELGPARARQLALPAATAQGMTGGQSVWTREELLDTVTPLGVARHLNASGIGAVVWEVERRAVRLADRVSPGIVRGGLPGPVWTTPAMLQVERAIVAHVAELAETPRLSVPESAVAGAIAAEPGRGRALDPEQQGAVRALCSPSGFVALIGVAGSGKTTVCRPAVEALTQAGYEVIGVSLAEGATQVLRAETGAESWNIADFLTRHETGQLRHEDGRPVELGPRTVLLVDEAGTVDSRTQLALLEVCRGAQVGARPADRRPRARPSRSAPAGCSASWPAPCRPATSPSTTARATWRGPTRRWPAGSCARAAAAPTWRARTPPACSTSPPPRRTAIAEAVGEWATNYAPGAARAPVTTC